MGNLLVLGISARTLKLQAASAASAQLTWPGVLVSVWSLVSSLDSLHYSTMHMSSFSSCLSPWRVGISFRSFLFSLSHGVMGLVKMAGYDTQK